MKIRRLKHLKQKARGKKDKAVAALHQELRPKSKQHVKYQEEFVIYVQLGMNWFKNGHLRIVLD